MQSLAGEVAWLDEGVVLHAFWEREHESIEWISAATGTFIDGLAGLIDVPQWLHRSRTPWPTDPQAQRELVAQSEIVIEGKPAGGYGLNLYSGNQPSPRLIVRAGTGRSGRIPLHYASLSLHPPYTAVPQRGAVNDLVALAIRAWQPLTVNFTTTRLHADAGRSGWDIPVGYRVWISPEVGTFTEVVEGLTAEPFEGGTLLSAPDDWHYLDVAEAMKATLEASGLDEIPHATATP